MSTFIAQYFGTCDDCLGSVLPGQEVTYNVRDDLVHVECPDVRNDPTTPPAKAETLCPRCTSYHAGEC